MKLKNMANRLLHALMIRHVLSAYDRKSKRVERKHPELFEKVDPALSRRHRELWSKTGLTSGDRWLRVHVNLTGIQDYTFCPEDIFFSCIERVMNDCNQSDYGVEEKNELWRYVPAGAEPEVLLRCIRGSFFDSSLNWLSESDAQCRIDNCESDLVGKPCRSSGGNGVLLFRKTGNNFQAGGLSLTTAWLLRQGESFVVQKKIQQSEFCASFNSSSINTLRIMTMRCPWNGKIVLCRSMMRMGVSDAVVDNMMKGGLCVCIGDHGQFGRYAYDYDGKRFEKHPVSGQSFDGLVYPRFGEIVEFAKRIHANIPFYNLLSFDIVPRQDGSICIVEINATSQGITQLQYDFGGLFGTYTEQVVDWVAKHRPLDSFTHIRTWY